MPISGSMEVTNFRPNFVVVGVGHSGTTILMRMLEQLGWNVPNADEAYAEHTAIREHNRYALAHDGLGDAEPITKLLQQLNQHKPWAVKDPRFTVTLPLWQPYFHALGADAPVLVHIKKDTKAVKASYLKRGELVRGRPGNRWQGAPRGLNVEEQLAYMAQTLKTWSGPFITIDYSQIAAATRLFQPR